MAQCLLEGTTARRARRLHPSSIAKSEAQDKTPAMAQRLWEGTTARRARRLHPSRVAHDSERFLAPRECSALILLFGEPPIERFEGIG